MNLQTPNARIPQHGDQKETSGGLKKWECNEIISSLQNENGKLTKTGQPEYSEQFLTQKMD